MAEEKSIAQINDRIRNGEARVLTDQELIKEIQEGDRFNWSEVDVIIISCQSTASGTAAMLCVPVAERGVFTRAEKIWLNDIPGFPGPAPNERLGLVDTLIFSDQLANNGREDYNGAELLYDLIKRERIHAKCLSVEGEIYESAFILDELEFARMYVYNFFLHKLCSENQSSSKANFLQTIRVGSKILLNKATGIVIGCGTRSAPESRSLSLAADMFEMDPEYIKQSEAKQERNMINSVVLAIPILNNDIWNDLKDYLLKQRPREFEDTNQDIINAITKYLKKKLQSGESLLICSDMHIKNWY